MALLSEIEPTAVTGVGWLADEHTGVVVLPVLLLFTADRLCGFIPDSIASKRANEDKNCISICSILVSKPASFDAVSDIFETDMLSCFPDRKGAKETYCVGVDATVGGVLVELFSFFFFKALLTVLRKVEMEYSSVFGMSKSIELLADKVPLVGE